MRGYCAGKLYAWHNVYRKKWNAKVRNYNLRGSENEMNLKLLNFIEINKMSGWQVAPLKVMNGLVHGCHVTPRPEKVHSICNCKGAYVHQVSL